ncbi:MAG TPA: ABC transporter permease subunit [Iamia sp.]
MSPTLRARLGVILPPVVLGVVLLVAWEIWVQVGRIATYLLPKPSAIGEQLDRQREIIGDAARISGTNALLGLLLGAALGIVMALLSSRFSVVRSMIAPVAAAANALPLIAVTPVLNNAIGSTSETPRRLVVALVVFFPVFLNLLKGLTQVQATHIELMRSYGASASAVARKVRLPGAVPYLATGLKVAAPLAVITAVVAEYFGGPQGGLGYFISTNASQTRTAQAWSYVVAACALGLLFFVAAVAVERVAAPGRPSISPTHHPRRQT